jgi:DNA-binding transcriptional regulator LsrR (DeoR family)
MRMVNKSMSEIAKQLGICKTSVFNVLDQAIKENPVMASIANCKRFETRGSKTSNVR